MDFVTALSVVKKDLTTADVHMDTAIGNPPKKPGRLKRLKAERMGKSIKATIAKAAPTGKELWAWASTIEVDGKTVIDSQGDIIEPEELEKAADQYITDSRDVGLMHTSTGHGRVVQSMVFTKELQQALGIDLGRVGWLVKMQITDPSLQKRIASGEIRQLSIGGSGRRKEI